MGGCKGAHETAWTSTHATRGSRAAAHETRAAHGRQRQACSIDFIVDPRTQLSPPPVSRQRPSAPPLPVSAADCPAPSGAVSRQPAPTPPLPGGLRARLDGLPRSRPKRRLARGCSDGGEGGREAEAKAETAGWGRAGAPAKRPRPRASVRGAPEGVAGREDGAEAEMGGAVQSPPSLGAMRPTRGPLRHLLGPRPGSCSPLPGAPTP